MGKVDWYTHICRYIIREWVDVWWALNLVVIMSLVVINFTDEHTGFGTLKLGDLMRGAREAAAYCVWAWTIINFMIHALTQKRGLTLLGHSRRSVKL